MICQTCSTDNAADVSQCVSCGTDLAHPNATQTLYSETMSSAANSPGSPTSDGSFLGGSFTLAPGTDFGPRYRIESLLGEGGMGKVYLAYDRELNRKVALKLIRPELAADPRSLERLKQELLLAASISHRHILRIHDLGEAAGIKFISMAYIEGSDLHDWIRREGRLPIDQCVRIARQFAGALEAAHAENVVHRDLKPRNILVDHSGQIYIADFGLAKPIESELSGMTQTGAIIGTPRYMAPEQVEAKPADQRTDIYAFGLILYEMTTGQTPFAGDSGLGILYERLKQKPKNPQLLNAAIPDYLAAIILHCLEKDPQLRYQNAGEILRDLDAASAPTVTVERPRPGPKARPALISAAVLGITVLLGAIAWMRPATREYVSRLLPSRAAHVSGVPPLKGGKYVAVLPLRVLGDQDWLKYLAEGMVESLSAKLFQSTAIHIASTAAVEKADRAAPLEKLGRDLGVNLIVQGSIREQDGQIVLVMSLENVASGQRIWTEEFSGSRQDALTMEDQVYGKLIRALEPAPSNAELARGAMHPTENMAAYDLYLKARGTFRGEKNARDPSSVKAALSFFDQAIRTDPGFALAYAGIADASLYMYALTRDAFWPDKALAAARQALQLNPNLPETRLSLGSVYLKTGKTAEAIEQLELAAQLAPNSDEGQRRLAGAYLAAHRTADAFDAYQRAIRLNPYYWANYNQLGLAYLQSGDTKSALQAFERVTELEPDAAGGYTNLGVVYFREGKWTQCVAAFEKATSLQPTFRGYSNLGAAYLNLKDYNRAVGVLEKAVALGPNDQEAAGNLADAYRAMKQTAKADAAYDRAIALAFKSLQVNPRDADTLGSLAVYYAKKNEPDRAREFVHRARLINPAQNSIIYDEALVDALTGQPAAALDRLREAFDKGYSPEPAAGDSDLDSLRALPEFNRLMARYSNKTR